MATTRNSDADDIYATFKEDVNMTAAELTKWLKTEESKSVGQDSGDGASIGHHSGERIVEILHKKKADLTPDDEAHMRKVHSYVARHSAQGPHHQKDVETSPLALFPHELGPRPAQEITPGGGLAAPAKAAPKPKRSLSY